MLVSSAVDHGFESRSGQTRTINLVFAAAPINTRHVLRSKSNDSLAHNNVCEE